MLAFITATEAWLLSQSKGSPVGKSVSDDIKESLEDAEFKAEYECLAPYEELAHILIMRRATLGLTQAELAARMGTTASAVSRVESGQYATSPQTLKKLVDAFGARVVLGFEFGSTKDPERARRFVGQIGQVIRTGCDSHPAAAVVGLVLLLTCWTRTPGIACAAFGEVAVGSGVAPVTLWIAFSRSRAAGRILSRGRLSSSAAKTAECAMWNPGTKTRCAGSSKRIDLWWETGAVRNNSVCGFREARRERWSIVDGIDPGPFPQGRPSMTSANSDCCEWSRLQTR
ncbi:MAG TPA: helix-turn-helix domain-containing protein [Solirubrobacterales bacterium]